LSGAESAAPDQHRKGTGLMILAPIHEKAAQP
jgi:hypothetical protein